jgi:hypothetical protein
MTKRMYLLYNSEGLMFKDNYKLFSDPEKVLSEYKELIGKTFDFTTLKGLQTSKVGTRFLHCSDKEYWIQIIEVEE